MLLFVEGHDTSSRSPANFPMVSTCNTSYVCDTIMHDSTGVWRMLVSYIYVNMCCSRDSHAMSCVLGAHHDGSTVSRGDKQFLPSKPGTQSVLLNAHNFRHILRFFRGWGWGMGLAGGSKSLRWQN